MDFPRRTRFVAYQLSGSMEWPTGVQCFRRFAFRGAAYHQFESTSQPLARGEKSVTRQLRQLRNSRIRTRWQLAAFEKTRWLHTWNCAPSWNTVLRIE